MRFETDRLFLRPWTEDDAESLFEYAKDPAVGPIAGWPVHTSVDNSKEIIKEVLSADETYAVCLKEDNRAIGSIGLIPPAQSHTKVADNEIEIGYWIGVPFWGKGLIPEAVRKLQEHAFVDLGCSAMWCGYYDGNEKSKKCQEKCGFTYHHTEENKPCELMGDVRTEHFTRVTKDEWMTGLKTNEVVLYIHGKGGSADESEHYRQFFPGIDVYGFDYKSEYPWEAKEEFTDKVAELSEKYNRIILIAESIGAYFSMNAGIGKFIDKAYFISPIVNLEKLILDMINWAGTSESELEKRKIIPVDFGDDLSWDYLQYLRNNKIIWDVPTEILYGSADNLQSIDTIQEFVIKESAKLTIMEGGEHWFHTDEQMSFLDQWLRTKISG
ncbi:GNAT family N-acetyltransferase [Ruminococcus sp. 5_1_39BFAA]|uniref:GNAT family N-acetyltransferase n=1 Tax=Ruminococcus sp. 5_1_39BFAA TaxID=457412 RepID=UPI003563EFDC